jgi:hypothetical protein
LFLARGAESFRVDQYGAAQATDPDAVASAKALDVCPASGTSCVHGDGRGIDSHDSAGPVPALAEIGTDLDRDPVACRQGSELVDSEQVVGAHSV